MTLVRQLFSLQELDLALDIIGGKAAEAERELEGRLSLGELEASLQAERQQLEESQGQHRLQRLEVETLRERSNHLDAVLYSGASTNPRELESLEHEATNTRVRLEGLDEQLVELGLQIEQSQAKIQAMEQELSDTRSAWEIRRAELTEQVNQLASERDSLVLAKGTIGGHAGRHRAADVRTAADK